MLNRQRLVSKKYDLTLSVFGQGQFDGSASRVKRGNQIFMKKGRLSGYWWLLKFDLTYPHPGSCKLARRKMRRKC